MPDFNDPASVWEAVLGRPAAGNAPGSLQRFPASLRGLRMERRRPGGGRRQFLRHYLAGAPAAFGDG